MRIQLRYFAALRDDVGVDREAVEVPQDVTTVGGLRQWLTQRSEAHAQALQADRPIRAALNLDMVDESASLSDGAEVAFFPPVTGG